MSFKVFLDSPFATIPLRADNGCAGYDLTSIEDTSVLPGERKLVSTGLIIQIPNNTYARISPRSGLSCKGIDIGAGVVDSTYRGIVKVLFINNSLSTYEIKVGNRIAQLILERIETPEITKVNNKEELLQTERNEGGFGSTGI
jgi:dUTP pyrophosphatase